MYALSILGGCSLEYRKHVTSKTTQADSNKFSKTKEKGSKVKAQPRPNYSIISLYYFVFGPEPTLTTWQGVDCKMASRERK